MPEPMEIPLPRCQYCGKDMPGPALFSWEHGAWVIFCVYCPHCRKTLHLHILPAIAAAAVVSAGSEPGSSIVPPS